jgi:hypothetical protein
VFGLLDITDTHLALTLHHKGKPVGRRVIDRSTWAWQEG